MDYFNLAQRSTFQRLTGFAVVVRDPAWIPMRNAIRDIISTKLAQVAWVPREAITALLSVPEQNPERDGILITVPFATVLPSGSPTPDKPAWIDTPDKRMWWDDFAQEINKASLAFAAKQTAAGQAIMRSAQLNATLWNAAYNIAKTLALPVTIPEEAAKRFLGSNVMLLLVIGGAVYLAHQRGAFDRRKPKTNPGRRRLKRKG